MHHNPTSPGSESRGPQNNDLGPSHDPARPEVPRLDASFQCLSRRQSPHPAHLVDVSSVDPRLKGVYIPVHTNGVPLDQETREDVLSFVKSLVASNKIDFDGTCAKGTTHEILEQNGVKILNRARYL